MQTILSSGPDDDDDDNKPERRDKVISVRFSDDEYRGLQERAQRAHMSMSDYVRIRMEYDPLRYRPFVTTLPANTANTANTTTFTTYQIAS